MERIEMPFLDRDSPDLSEIDLNAGAELGDGDLGVFVDGSVSSSQIVYDSAIPSLPSVWDAIDTVVGEFRRAILIFIDAAEGSLVVPIEALPAARGSPRASSQPDLAANDPLLCVAPSTEQVPAFGGCLKQIPESIPTWSFEGLTLLYGPGRIPAACLLDAENYAGTCLSLSRFGDMLVAGLRNTHESVRIPIRTIVCRPRRQ